ncbi:MAG: glycine cleavage system protein T [Nitrosomonadaceae bacterium]|nr:glycine cleavage system protein T [Nitrosomonadaceae bacterium]|tara:strand:+ start:17925 stop:18950 length:1026 start_codon:yes stop_codon:yes gene_type:complete
MNSIWSSFLQKNNAIIENNHIIHYGNAAAELKNTHSNTVIADLSHYGLIHFSGEDALPFLQGQLSCDVREIDHRTARYGCYCTPKGRMLTTFLIWKDSSGYLIQIPTSLLSSLENKLSKYILRAKVQLNNSSNEYIRIGIAGDHASEIVKKIFGEIPNQSLSIINNTYKSSIFFTQNRFEIITTPDHAPKLWDQLKKDAIPVGKPCWDWLEIKAGIPIILPSTQEQFIPQMVNLEAIGGISFNKGCYPGQEIVSRTQYLGKIKRRMYLAKIKTEKPIIAGDDLYNDKEQPCGMVVNATLSPEGGYDLLAVIQIDSVKNKFIYWKDLKEAALEIMPLPYILK